MKQDPGTGSGKTVRIAVVIVSIIIVLGAYYQETLFRKTFFIMDHSLQNYPFREYVRQQVQQGAMPLWCPHIVAGFPLFAEGQSGILFPLNFFASSFLATWQNYSVHVLGAFVLGAIGIGLYLISLKLRPGAVLLGSVVWCLNGFMLTHSMFINFFQGAMIIPFALWSIERYAQLPGIKNFLAIIACMICIILAGHPQLSFIAVLIVMPYFIVRCCSLEQCIAIRMSMAILIVLVACIVCMVQILPSLELFAESYRSEEWTYDRMTEMSFPPGYLIHLLMPYFHGNPADNTEWSKSFGYFWEFGIYLGILPLLFIPFSFFSGSNVRRITVFYSVVLLVSLILALGKFSFLYRVLTWLPGYSFRAPARFLLLFVLSGSILSAIGFHFLAGRPENGTPKFPVGIIRKKIPRIIFLALLVTLTVGDLYVCTYRYHEGISPELYTRSSPFLETVTGGTQKGRVHTEIFEPVSGPRWHSGWKLNKSAYQELYTGFWMYCGVPWGVLSTSTVNGGWSPYHSRYFKKMGGSMPLETIKLLATRYIILADPGNIPGYKRVKKTDNLALYEDEHPFPMVFVINNLVRVKPGYELFEMKKPGFNLRTDAVCTDKSVQPYWIDKPVGRIEKISWHDQWIESMVHMDRPGVVFISSKYNNGWKLFIDGKPGNLLRLNYIFCGVFVDSGNHTIRLIYEPYSFKLGFYFTAAGMAGIFFTLIIMPNAVFRKREPVPSE